MRVLGDAQAIDDRAVLRGTVELGRPSQVCGRDPGYPLHRLGRVVTEQRAQLLQPVGALRQEGVVGVAVLDQQVGEAVEHRHVGPGPALEVHVGVVGQLDAPRIDDDELGSGDHALLDARADHGMALGRIRPGEQEAIGAVEVVEGVRPARQTERGAEAGRRGRVAQARAVVHIVVAHHPHQLLDQVVLLVGGACRGDGADRARPVALDDPSQALGDVPERLVPADLLELAVAAHERAAQPVGGAQEPVREAALHAGVAAIDGRPSRRRDRHHGAVARVRVQRAAHPAVATRRRGRLFDRQQVEQTRLRQRPGRARVDAGAAAHAGRAGPVGARDRRHHGAEPAAHEAQREGALDLVAHAHAARAGDAQVAIELDVGVRVIAAAVAHGLAEPARIDAEATAYADELAALCRNVQRPLRQFGDQQLEHALRLGDGGGIVGAHDHVLADRRGACGDRRATSLDSDETDATRAHRGQPLVEAQGRHVDAGRRGRVEHRRPLLDIDRAAVHAQPHRPPPGASSSA